MSSTTINTIPSESSNSSQNLQELQQQQTTELYRKALTYNVIGKYDPKIKHLITHTYHSTIFKYDTKEENWNKLEIEGVLSLYSRNIDLPDTPISKAEILSKELYPFGLIILNRLNLENFSVGLLNNSNVEDASLKLELRDGLVIIKSLSDETFGIWIHDEQIREDIYKSLEFIIG